MPAFQNCTTFFNRISTRFSFGYERKRLIQRLLNQRLWRDQWMTTFSRPIHKVFINFRGKGLRSGFVSHLIDALERHNINFFIDTHEQKGRNLEHLFKRIKEATVALVILSTRYAESKWCLEELRTIIEQSEKGEMIVIPIFYKVKPEDVRRQKNKFGYYFWKQSEESSLEEMEKWQTALKAVSNKVGFKLEQNRSEAKFIKKVIKEVGKDLTIDQYDDSVKKVKTNNLASRVLPYAWFGSAVGLIGAILLGFGLLTDTVHKCSSPAMVAMVGQFGSILARSSCSWADKICFTTRERYVCSFY